ncbi:Hypothetical protein CINCED_3A023004 [Cinara cedri]|uniref:Uncharacterized protein n=1 Tax=Cinara cedri TaxID=506608 RepID=A0A5E4MPV0_9HEMI|nr:Hypothetical protein CINCED_3A023004 [Cinara cedri]
MHIIVLKKILLTSLFVSIKSYNTITELFDDQIQVSQIDVPLQKEYNEAFRKKLEVPLDLNRLLRIYENGFDNFRNTYPRTKTVLCDYNKYNNTSSETSKTRSWATHPLQCFKQLEIEMELIYNEMIKSSAELIYDILQKYVDETLIVLRQLAHEPCINKRPSTFDLISISETNREFFFALRFILMRDNKYIEEIFEIYMFFSARNYEKSSITVAELYSLVESIPRSGNKRTLDKIMSIKSSCNPIIREPQTYHFVWHFDTYFNQDTNVSNTRKIDNDETILHEQFEGIPHEINENIDKNKRILKSGILKFTRPFLDDENSSWISYYTLDWSFLKYWKYYNTGFFMDISLSKHKARVNKDTRISLNDVFEDIATNASLDRIMAVNQLVPFIIHNYIAHIVMYLYGLTIIAYQYLSQFIMFGQTHVGHFGHKINLGSVFVKNRHAFYKYFKESLSVFEVQYELFCDIIKHDPAKIVRLLQQLNLIFDCSGDLDNYLKSANKIKMLQHILINNFKWDLNRFTYLVVLRKKNYNIVQLMDNFDNINKGFNSLIEQMVEAGIDKL